MKVIHTSRHIVGGTFLCNYIIPTNEKRNITYFGQMIRRNNTHRLILDGPLEGKVSRGRLRTEWMTNITEWMGMRYVKLGIFRHTNELID